jgi:oligosaccharide repeat unit polymerase
VSLISGICFTICILLIIPSLRRHGDVFAPHRVFGFVWFLAIGLADFKYSFYQHDWSLYSWIVILIGVCSTMLGFFIVAVIYLDQPMLSLSEQRKHLVEKSVNGEILFRSVMVLAFLYAIGFVIEVLIAGGVPAFAAKPDRARVDFGFFGTHLIVTTMPTILLLGTEYIVYFWKQSTKVRRSFVVIAYAFVFFSFALLLVRFLYVMWAIPTLCFLYYGTNRVKFKHIGLSLLGFFGLLEIIRSIRLVGYVENYSYVTARMRFSKTYAVFTEPYMYIVMNLENFARSVERWTTYTYGYFTFDFFMALTGIKHPLAKEYGIIERPFLISGYNTFSFLMPFYQDFGVIGVALIPFCIGIGVGYLYHSMRRRPTVANAMVYSFAVSVLVISFFVHALGMLSTFVNLFILVFVHFEMTHVGKIDQTQLG